MERRRAIKKIGKSFGAFAVTPAVLELLQSCSGPQCDWTPIYYSQQEGAFVKQLIDTFLPAADEMPAASDVNVHIFLDKYANEVLDESQKGSHKLVIQKAIISLSEVVGEEKIESIQTFGYEKWLDQLLDESAADDKVSDFIMSFRDQIIWAYKNTELVGETIMAYNPIPGKYEGCVDLMETTNGKAWSV